VPAPERARRIEGRLRAIAADRSVPPGAVAVVESDLGSALAVGERRIMVVTDADAARERTARPLLASLYRDRLREAIERYRAARTPRAIGRGLALSAAALAAGILAIVLVHRGRRRLQDFLQRRIARLGSLKFRSFEILDSERISRVLRGGLRAAETLAILLAAVLATEFALAGLPWTRPLALDLFPYLLAPLRSVAEGIYAALPGLLYLFVLVVLTRWLLRLTRLFFAGLDAGTVTLSGFERDWAWPTYRIVRVAVVAFAAVMAYPHVPGSDSGAFKGVSILMGVVLSLGSSSFVANIIAGYALTYRRPFRIGDRVKVGGTLGNVEEIRVTQTRLRTPKNEIAVIPNSTILAGEVLNYSALARAGGLILHTTVGIGYETPWRQVEAMLLLAADRTPEVSKEPAPFVLETALGDFCITYELNVYCADPRQMERLYAALHRSVLDVFNEHGVQIMTPAYVADTPEPKVVPPAKWFESPARPPGTGQPPAEAAAQPAPGGRSSSAG
jgi:small-conductance mechanosensitive channel